MQAFIDCFKGDLAVIHLQEELVELLIPRSLLPAGAQTGSWLQINIELDPSGAGREEKNILGQLKNIKKP